MQKYSIYFVIVLIVIFFYFGNGIAKCKLWGTRTLMRYELSPLYYQYKPIHVKEKQLYTLVYSNKLPIIKDTSKIPKILFQTYYNKKIIPSYMVDNVKKYAKNYEYYLLDDTEAIAFLNTYFNKDVTERFKLFKNGAHKADLLRYCLLYIYGGVYTDIKTILLKPLDSIFTDDTKLYSTLSATGYSIHQGILASRPRNILFLRLIYFAVYTPVHIIDNNYLILCVDFYKLIQDDSINNTVCIGEILGRSQDYYLFNEVCNTNTTKTCKKFDKHGLCCSIYDKEESIFITRDPNFPWK